MHRILTAIILLLLKMTFASSSTHAIRIDHHKAPSLTTRGKALLNKKQSEQMATPNMVNRNRNDASNRADYTYDTSNPSVNKENNIPTPTGPDPERSLQVLQASTFLLALSTSLVGFSPAPALTQALGADKATKLLSSLSAGAAFLEILASPALGSCLDSFGRKPVLVGALAALAVANGVTALQPSVLSICVSKFVGMFFMGSFFISTQAITSDLTSSDPQRLGAAMGLTMALVSAAFFLGALVAGYFSKFGLSVSYTASAGIGSLIVALVGLGLPETLPTSNRLPFQRHRIRQLIIQSPLSCTRLLFQHGKQVRLLAILFMLQQMPLYMRDLIQIYATKEWNLSTQQFSFFVAMIGVTGIAANTVGSVLIKRLGISPFLRLATLSSLMTPLGASLFGFPGLLVGSVLGFLGAAQHIAINAALISQGSKAGVPQGQLAGERSSLAALLKVIAPILYSALYIQGGKQLGVRNLPFLFNVVVALGAFVLSQWYLPV